MSSFLYDTHSHIDLVNDFNQTISEIEERKIYTIAVTNLPPLYQNLQSKLNSKYIRPALGFHPELIGEYQKYISKMWELLPEAKYIGEVGLDFKVAVKTKDVQIKFFEELISKCNHLGGKILTIHSRASADEVVSIVGNTFNSKFILHWYSGSLITLNKAIENGAFFSINYAMVNSDNGLKIISNIPNDRLLLESDAPFVMLNKNTPFGTKDINKIVDKLAILKGMKTEEMKFILWNNFKSLL